MLQLIYELRKNCCGQVDGEKSKVLQEVLADLKRFVRLGLSKAKNKTFSLSTEKRCQKIHEKRTPKLFRKSTNPAKGHFNKKVKHIEDAYGIGQHNFLFPNMSSETALQVSEMKT